MSVPASPGKPRGFLTCAILRNCSSPDLPDLSLETLAAWLGVVVVERHRALADAKLAAEVFLALLPRLRENSIRTLAEAEDACRKLAASRPDRAWRVGMKLRATLRSCSRGQLSLPAPGKGCDVKAAAICRPVHEHS